ncbi:insulinase family protein [Actinoplanes sp. NEAU-A12]|uniref:Insulinase family protein n=1 Tax=Actinoplanes sandaracinus TaxID=3045177 RepID=A0ABT6WHC2_9ACTN|nr:insulinase family protein [Actinoplanes sandaracinus]MDI6099137.1 insulinase family protein [Actinoplanes sandaracinus]
MTTALISPIRPYVRADPRWRIAAVSLAVGAGHRADREGHRGLAHLSEHLVMRHRPTAHGPDLFAWLEGVGGIAEAHTWPDHSAFTLLVPPAAVGEAIQRFAAAMPGPAAQQVMAEEIDKIEEEIDALGPGRGFPWGLAAAALYGGDPVPADGFGLRADLRRLSVEQVSVHQRAHYVPVNSALAVVGDIRPRQVQRLIDQVYAGSSAPPAPGAAPAPRAGTRTVRRPGEPPAVLLAYPMPDLHQDPASYLATVMLTAVVARRVQATVPSPVRIGFRAGMFGAAFHARHADLALAHVRGGPETAHSALRGYVDRVLLQVGAGPVHRSEMERAADTLRLHLLEDLDGPDGHASMAARAALLWPAVGPPHHLTEQIRVLPPDAVSRAAERLTAGPVAEIRVIGSPP